MIAAIWSHLLINLDHIHPSGTGAIPGTKPRASCETMFESGAEPAISTAAWSPATGRYCSIMKKTFFAFTLAACFLPVAHADEISDTISEGLKKYEAGEISGAGSSLQYALNLLNEKKAEALLALLPKELDGWKGNDGESNSLGILGGGVTINREYTKGDKRATLSITMDSPLVQQMAGLLANPAFAGQMGMKIRPVGDEKASYNADQGELSLVLNNTILFKVEARGCSEEEILGLARGIDIGKIKGMK